MDKKTCYFSPRCYHVLTINEMKTIVKIINNFELKTSLKIYKLSNLINLENLPEFLHPFYPKIKIETYKGNFIVTV